MRRILLLGLVSMGIAAVGTRPDAMADRSSTLAALDGSGTLVVANEESRSVSIVDTVSRSVERETALAGAPQTLIVDTMGRAWIARRDRDGLTVIDTVDGEVLDSFDLDSCVDPFGITSLGGQRLAISCERSDHIAVFDVSSSSTIATIATAHRPRGLALSADGSRLYVTHFLSGSLSVIDTGSLAVVKVVSTGADSNLSQSVVLDEAGRVAWMPQTRSNATNPALLFDTTVFPIVSAVDLDALANDSRRRIAIDIADQPANMPSDAVLASDGRLFIVHAGSNDGTVIDTAKGTGHGHFETGLNPRGIALSPDETVAYVNNALDGSISVIDTSSLTTVATIPVTTIPLEPQVLRGKVLFHSSATPDLAKDRWISCAVCHPDGGMDGRTWFFRDGPRNTPSLSGVHDTLPIHWSGDLDELQDVESTLRSIQAGTGLATGPANCDPSCDSAPPNAGRSSDLDALAAFMASLPVRTSPNLVGGRLSDDAQRGRAIFFSAATRCAACHPSPLFTDRTRHDVGTGRGPKETKGTSFDTPSLRGVHATAPYLHDGSASTLRAVLTTANASDLHGATSHLTANEIDDLVEFLRSLPYSSARKRNVRRPE